MSVFLFVCFVVFRYLKYTHTLIHEEEEIVLCSMWMRRLCVVVGGGGRIQHPATLLHIRV